MGIEIKAFIKNSLIDWDGKISSVVCLPGCNFRCPFCQNSELILNPSNIETIEFTEIENYLKENKIFIDGVCVTGGEPCLYEELPQFLEKFKQMNFLIKLDTNGFYPEKLKKIIEAKLVDYIAMDIKAPFEKEHYERACGIKHEQLLANIKRSARLLMRSSLDYEFRVTVVPGLHAKKEISQIARSLKGAKKIALQNFSNHQTLNPEFKKIKPYSIEDLENMAEDIKSSAEQYVVRGAV